jgi:hypothetical protein
MDARTTITDAPPGPSLTHASAAIIDLATPARADGPASRAA